MTTREAPPPGPPWDSPLHEAPLAFLDLEMSGLDVTRDRVLEIAIERVVGGEVVGRLAALVAPDDGTFGNEHIHGIRSDELRGAPTFAALAPRILELLDGAIPVAHGAAMDDAFLHKELVLAGVVASPSPFLDTLVLSRRAFAARSHALSQLAQKLELGERRAHRAADDVATLRALFERLVSLLSPASPRDLLQVRIGEGRARDSILALASEAVASGTPVRVTHRARRRPAEDLDLVLTEVRAKLDPPTLLGYLLRCRSRRELRADRVLAIGPVPDPVPR